MTNNIPSHDYRRGQRGASPSSADSSPNPIYPHWSNAWHRESKPCVITLAVQMSIAWPFNVSPHLHTNILLAAEYCAVKPKAYYICFDGPAQYVMHEGVPVMKINATVFVYF